MGREHPATGLSLFYLAITYIWQSRYETAKPLLRRSLMILERAFGFDSMRVAQILEPYAYVLRVTKQNREAAQLKTRAKFIRDKHAQENGVKSDNEEDINVDLINNGQEMFYHEFEY